MNPKLGLLAVVLLGVATVEARANDAERLQRAGLEAFNRGAFEDAVKNWDQADALLAQSKDVTGRIDASVRLGAAYQALGQNKLAIAVLSRAAAWAEEAGDRRRLVQAQTNLGLAYVASRRVDLAEQTYERALAVAREENDPKAIASLALNLGNLRLAQERLPEALESFQTVARLAREAHDDALAAQALSNAALVATRAGQKAEANQLNADAVRQLGQLKPSHEQAYLLTLCGRTYRQLGNTDAAGEALRRAEQIADSLDDQRARSYALGELGALAESTGKFDEAYNLTRQAAFAAQQIPEALYRWEWQTGRILKAQGQREPAIAAYRRAVQTLQQVRNDLSQNGCPSCHGTTFREFAGPVYFEYADLLLRRADELTDAEQIQATLYAARDVVEQLKSFELEDYFQDDCASVAQAKGTSIEKLSEGTAVIYYIPLADRTEILIGFRSGLERCKAPVGAAQLTEEVRRFRHHLEKRTTHEYLAEAQQLYNWLLRPLLPVLTARHITTLVFVPDGALRTVPLAALHDGENFLVKSFSVAVSPGLTLTDRQAERRGRAQLLLAGLSEGVQGFAPLDYVPTEMRNIGGLYHCDQLLNEQFLTANLDREFAQNQYSLVHIASHGQFDRNIANTFILTFDGNLTMNSLEGLIRPSQFRGKPVELLTLSACQTAAGDDRAALGLAGVAVKAGAESALATLWYVNDQASTFLVSEFYSEWQKDPTLSKAGALAMVQSKMIADKRFRHPCYWAPYLLIGNWL